MAKVIGALWTRESRNDGKKYFSGQLDLGVFGTVQIAIFRNDRRQNDRQPTHNIVLSEPMPFQPLEPGDVQEVEPDDDIPF